MLHRFRDWLRGRYLPAWAVESLKEENEALRRRNRDLTERLHGQQLYIDGMQDVIHALCPDIYMDWGDRHGNP